MATAQEDTQMQVVNGEEANNAAQGFNAGDDAIMQMVNREITRKIIAKRAIMTTYLFHRKRIERLTIAMALHGNDKKLRKVRQWKRELNVSTRKVQNIAANNF